MTVYEGKREFKGNQEGLTKHPRLSRSRELLSSLSQKGEGKETGTETWREVWL